MKLSSDWVQLLLGRAEAPCTLPRGAFLGKRILITGAGGSIGSALVEGALKLQPEHIVALDQSEYGLHELLLRLSPSETLAVTPQLGSTNDSDLMDQILGEGVDIVIHAAAHKYVPLLESNARAAFINNVEGTILPALACARAGDINFVCVSSDKAAEPKNVLGISKRLAELAISACHTLNSRSSFTGIRLPNVLGSTGSVVPLFLRQASEGGPLTVTDQTATRYFISMNEAVHEILNCAVHPARGSLVIPQTHDPINIFKMALSIGMKWGLSQESVVGTDLRDGDCQHELLVAPGEVQKTDEHGRHCIELPRPNAQFLNAAMEAARDTRRRDDRWAKDRLEDLLQANDSLQDRTAIAYTDMGDQEALNCP